MKSPAAPLLSKSKPEKMPVLDGAVNRYGYSMGAAVPWGTIK